MATHRLLVTLVGNFWHVYKDCFISHKGMEEIYSSLNKVKMGKKNCVEAQ